MYQDLVVSIHLGHTYLMTKLMAVGTAVKILSANGTGRVAGKGEFVGMQGASIALVRKANGKTLAVNTALVTR